VAIQPPKSDKMSIITPRLHAGSRAAVAVLEELAAPFPPVSEEINDAKKHAGPNKHDDDIKLSIHGS
jgi:hypothetical protein